MCRAAARFADGNGVRRLRLIALTAVGLPLLPALPACDDEDGRLSLQVMPVRHRVELGPIEDYADVGVVTDHVADHGLFVVTTRPADEKILVALRATCPHDGQRVIHDELSNRFKCPRGGHRFTLEGLPATTAYQGPALVRVAVMNKHGKLTVAPEHEYRFQAQEWSLEPSMLLLPPDADDDADPG